MVVVLVDNLESYLIDVPQKKIHEKHHKCIVFLEALVKKPNLVF